MIVRIFLNKQQQNLFLNKQYCEAKENSGENQMANNCCQFDTNNANNERLSYLYISEKKYTKIND